MTTAHSVTGDNVGTLIARAGEWDTQSIREPFPSVESNVACIVVHEQFQRRTGTYNIALLFLETPINNAEHINTVCLPPPHLSFDGQNCFVSGWGKDKFGQEGKYQPILKKIDMSVLDNQKCTAMFRNTRLGKYFTLNESLICAGGEEGKDACEGDGGSPLVCPVPGKKGRFYQAGIVAWGVQCGTANVPGAYTNVAFFADWIQEKIEDNKQIENNIKKIYGNERLQKDKFW